MEPKDFKDKNCVCKAKGCKDLPALKIQDKMISCWKMDEEEKRQFDMTGIIYLTCIGAQPPILLSVEKPYSIVEKED